MVYPLYRNTQIFLFYYLPLLPGTLPVVILKKDDGKKTGKNWANRTLYWQGLVFVGTLIIFFHSVEY